MMSDCLFCRPPQPETVLWRDDQCRILHAGDPDYPGFLRVVWNAHVAEMTDLDIRRRQYLMSVVFAAEAVLRELLHPDKINLASLGNLVPHLHWHVIARFADDAHFPDPVWAPPRRPAGQPRPLDLALLRRRLAERLHAEASR
jgi:diadenosine tetraphosphate (Ap4A) HIT family hydrolase